MLKRLNRISRNSVLLDTQQCRAAFDNKQVACNLLEILQDYDPDSAKATIDYVETKPNIIKMLHVRRFNIVWPAPQAWPDRHKTPYIVEGPTKVYCRISLQDLLNGAIAFGEATPNSTADADTAINYSIAVDSVSLHLLATCRNLTVSESFSAIAHLQKWYDDVADSYQHIAILSLTQASRDALANRLNKDCY